MIGTQGITKYTYTSYHWEFPGGKIESGEAPQEALHRELLEEMDKSMHPGKYYDEYPHDWMSVFFMYINELKLI